jgi:hypothetical protein
MEQYGELTKQNGGLKMNRKILLTGLLITAALSSPVAVRGESDVFRIGMIGLDTSHVIAFTRDIHNPDNNYGCRVVVGYPGGSPDIESSASRVEGYTRQLRDEFGIEMTDSIEELCEKVDGVMLMSVDGRPHLEQIKPVIAAGKPVYIDYSPSDFNSGPLGRYLGDVLYVNIQQAVCILLRRLRGVHTKPLGVSDVDTKTNSFV